MLERFPRWARIAGLAVAMLVLVGIAFGRSLWQGYSPIDDFYLIYDNIAIRGITPATLKLAFTTYDPELYIPLTLVSFQVNYVISGLAPWSYHLVNLLLHAANATLVFLLLKKFVGKEWVALAGAIMFAVHPLQTEAVVWIAGRKDLLSGFFYLGALLLYIKFREGKRAAYPLSLAWFALALLSKVMAITLPVAIILYELFVRRRALNRKTVVAWVPYALLSALFVVIAAGGKERYLSDASQLHTFLMAARSTVFYVQKFLWPSGLNVLYPYQGTITLADPAFFIPVLLIIAAGAMAFWQRRERPWIAFGLAWYVLILAPTFLNFSKGGFMFIASDRYAYLPLIGLLVIVCECLAALWERWGEHTDIITRWIASIIAVSVLVGLSVLQTTRWDTPEGIFQRSIALYPDAVIARTGLANIYLDQKKYEEAFAVLKEGLRYGDHVQLHLSAGNVYAAAGDTASAEEQFRIAMKMDPKNPIAVFSIGSLAEQRGDLGLARSSYEKAVAMDASYVGARVGLARVLKAQGKIPEAKAQLQEALRWNPSAEEARQLLESLAK